MRDAATLDGLMHAAFTLGGAKELDRPLLPRAVWMENTMKNLTIDPVRYKKMAVAVTGNVAVVRSSFYRRGALGSQKFSDSTYRVNTWLKQGSKWRVIGRLSVE